MRTGHVDVVSAVDRHDAKFGWVVDVRLAPAATARLARDTQFFGVVNTTPVNVTRAGNTFVLSNAGLTGAPWDEAAAKQLAAAATTSGK